MMSKLQLCVEIVSFLRQINEVETPQHQAGGPTAGQMSIGKDVVVVNVVETRVKVVNQYVSGHKKREILAGELTRKSEERKATI